MKPIATANYDFEKLITEGCVYVDKTDMLGKLASAKDAIYFISRPRHGWEFMRADGSASETNSAAWRAVRVPHDWGVEKSFDPKKPYGDAYLEPTGDEGELFLN